MCFGVFSGIWETENDKNKNLFYFRGFCGAAFVLFCGGGGGVHLGMWSRNSCYFADVSKIGQDSAGRSAFCLLHRFVFGALYLNMPLFRVFRAFLAGLGVSCGFVLLACFAWLVGLLCA